MDIKLLYITNGITGIGGLERVLSVKASMLADRGYEVHILSLNEGDKQPFFDFSPKVIRHSVCVEGNPLLYLLQYKNRLQKIVKIIKPDLISVCDDGLKGFFIPTILGRKTPVIYERHASVQLNNSTFQHWIMRNMAPTFCKIIVLTKGNLKEWRSGNTAVIPNPLSFYPEVSAQLSSKKVITVGSHSYNKGYDLLLNAWQKIEKICPEWTLNIYGKYTDDTYRTMADSLHLQHVTFHQPMSNIEDYYLESSVFVLPSRSEGFGMVIIEAMSCGLPVVSFDCPQGPADIITDGKNGFLVENGNAEQLAEKVTALLQSGRLRQQFGAAGKETAKKYMPEVIIEQWDELFRNLLKNRNE